MASVSCAPARILVVDDQPENTRLLSALLGASGFAVHTANGGAEALDWVAQSPPDLVLLDLMMPVMDGVEVCRRLKSAEATRYIPVIILTGNAEREANLRAVEAGADEFILKPFDSVILDARIRHCIRTKQLQDALLEHQHDLERRVEERTGQVRKTQRITVFALAKLAESRDTETGDHLERMRRYAKVLAETLSSQPKYRKDVTPEFVEELYFSTPLHDIGKVGIPDAILLKPGKLTPGEFAIMKSHTGIGGDTLKAADLEAGQDTYLRMGRDIAYYHHEQWSGKGYPFGLQGEQIPLPARIAALADVYDALSSKRPYKEPFSHEQSKAIVLEGRGTHFDPDIVDAFLACEEAFLEIRNQFQGTGALAPLAVLASSIDGGGAPAAAG